jgi:hypothetical protein
VVIWRTDRAHFDICGTGSQVVFKISYQSNTRVCETKLKIAVDYQNEGEEISDKLDADRRNFRLKT